MGCGAKPRIPVSVVVRKLLTMTPTNTLDDAFGRLNVERAAISNSHANLIGSDLLPRGDLGPHHVARGESVNALLTRQITSRPSGSVRHQRPVLPVQNKNGNGHVW